MKARYAGAAGAARTRISRNGKGDAYAYCKACHRGAIDRRWTSERAVEAMLDRRERGQPTIRRLGCRQRRGSAPRPGEADTPDPVASVGVGQQLSSVSWVGREGPLPILCLNLELQLA